MNGYIIWTKEMSDACIAIRDDQSPARKYREYNDADVKSRAREFCRLRHGCKIEGAQYEYFVCFIQRLEPDYDTEAGTHKRFMRAVRQAQDYALYHYLGKPSPATAEGAIVMRRGVAHEEDYVTHFFNMQDGGYHQGHYFKDFEKAQEDFKNRVRRGY